jgi:hypothetical protein
VSAIISACGRYRYRLERRQDKPGPVVAFFGVNPSTANADTEDATTRKWHGFCERNGWGKYVVGNVFAYRSTDVACLAKVDDPVGTENQEYITSIAAGADLLVPCWGNTAKVPPNLRRAFSVLLKTLVATGKPMFTFGLTRSGDPKHPLMLGYDTRLLPFHPRIVP